jgi:multiple sugar transport system permease protein
MTLAAALPTPIRSNRLRAWLPYLLIAPSVVLLLLVIAYPLIFALKSSFYFWNLQRSADPQQFVGLANYQLVLSGPDFRPSLWNTVLFSVVGTGVEFCFGLAIALVLANQLPGMAISRAMLIMPTTIAPVVVGFLFRYIYDPTGGLVPWLLQVFRIGAPAQGLLGNEKTAIWAVLAADVWEWTPFFAIVLYAGLLSVPDSLIEAARLDGASAFTILRRIRLPLIKRTAMIVLILRFMQLFNTFDLVLVLTRGGPGAASRTLGYALYQEGLVNFNIGVASATTWLIVLIVNVIITLWAFFAFRDWDW